MPGSGPGGVPAAIALTPILSARYRDQDLERIAAAAPGARLVTVSLEGLADGPLDDVEVMLRGPLPAATFERILARAPSLSWVHSATAGVERVLPAARSRDLTITNARGVFSEPIAEYVLMMMLAIIRRLPQLLELQRERTWQPLLATEMRDVTVGIVGLGSIGRAVATRSLAFGSRVVAMRRQAVDPAVLAADDPSLAGIARILGPDQLPELLAESDMVVLALPLTPDTRDLFDASTFAAMKRGSWLINVARGGLVNERDLLRALATGPMAGAVLDAFRDEPLPAHSPLYGVSNLIVTPHTSWTSGRVLDRSVGLFRDNLLRWIAGEPLLNTVDVTKGY
jgi:phosphoglycerate dehydrogenase-like enzyme